MAALTALRDDPARTADHGHFPGEGVVAMPDPSGDEIVGVLCDLFAGRTRRAFGEDLEWWMETCADLRHQDLAGALLPALSKWPFDHRAGEPGVQAMRAELISRARMLIERSVRDTGEAPL